jgi:predicted unusual protein kinase regulating ubiquinone biosynthesis (AarF/ABC1/UbiB family)
MDSISKIIEDSTGKKMTDLFLEFEERPIGSASIAQAHRATLLGLT